MSAMVCKSPLLRMTTLILGRGGGGGGGATGGGGSTPPPHVWRTTARTITTAATPEAHLNRRGTPRFSRGSGGIGIGGSVRVKGNAARALSNASRTRGST